MNVNDSLDSALEFQQAGDLKQAEYIYREILIIQPENADALHFLGVLFCQSGNCELGIQYIRQAIHFKPTYAEAYYNLGRVLQDKGQLDKAINYYQKTIKINPDFDDAYYNLGLIYQNKGQLDKAITCYQEAIEINPDSATIYNSLGNAFQEKGQPRQAIEHYRKAIEIDPYLANTYNNLGLALLEIYHFEEAVMSYKQAIGIKSDYIEAYINLGNALGFLGKTDEAIVAFDNAINYRPDYFTAKLAKCMWQLPFIYPDQTSIQTYRKRYYDELTKLRNEVSLTTQKEIEEAAISVGAHQPFLLAYQGLNDRELQQIYGELICSIMVLRYPQWSTPPPMQPFVPEKPLRIGIVSGFFYNHSNWKIPIKGWIENIDRKRFNLYGYYTGKWKDTETEVARQFFNQFIENTYSFENLCQIIRDDNLHVLIYPEIGMNALAVRLAALRLAPVQCTSWGHPDTSGLQTIDYYLSSDLMEPHDADNHYSERLIRLPNLSIYYRPLDITPAPINRETYRLNPDSILYLCCQTPRKYLPQYDDIFPLIAQQVGNCIFLFISAQSSLVTEQFRSRLKLAFDHFKLNIDDFCVFLPRLTSNEYYAINCMADIFLDSIGWSGCNSTFEAIACNLPIVTLPGELMRGRHTTAILTMMEMTETIASTLDEYIELSVRLGQDLEWRKQISNKIAANKHLVYRDRTCITALENFIERVVREKID